MSENHFNNLIQKLANFEAETPKLKGDCESIKGRLKTAINLNAKMRDIEAIEEMLDIANARLSYNKAQILSLRRRIKRAS